MTISKWPLDIVAFSDWSVRKRDRNSVGNPPFSLVAFCLIVVTKYSHGMLISLSKNGTPTHTRTHTFNLGILLCYYCACIDKSKCETLWTFFSTVWIFIFIPIAHYGNVLTSKIQNTQNALFFALFFFCLHSLCPQTHMKFHTGNIYAIQTILANHSGLWFWSTLYLIHLPQKCRMTHFCSVVYMICFFKEKKINTNRSMFTTDVICLNESQCATAKFRWRKCFIGAH